MSNIKRYIYLAEFDGISQHIAEISEDEWFIGLAKHKEHTGSDTPVNTCDCGHFFVGKVLAGIGVVTHIYRIDNERVMICVER